MDLSQFEPLAIALAVGLLVGLQRERTSRIAGIRTFALISLLGSLCAMLASTFGNWVIVVGFLSVSMMLIIGNVAQFREEEIRPGLTTEIAALVMYAVGAALVQGHTVRALAVSGIVAILLNWKQGLQSFVGKLSENDFKAFFQLVLVGLVILPMLPNKTYGWYNVLNPYKIWLMVVLISSISLIAYVAYKFLGERVGAVLGGVLGGLISSTATTVSFARQTKDNPDTTPNALLVILIASTILMIRILFEIGVVAPGFLPTAAVPLGIELILMAILCVIVFRRVGHINIQNPDHSNPAQLTAAIIFGGLYAVILLAVAAAKTRFGTGGMYIVAMVSGLTDMDAITLSTAELVKTGHITPHNGWRLILVATLSNLIFKGGAVAFLGRSSTSQFGLNSFFHRNYGWSIADSILALLRFDGFSRRRTSV